MNEGTFNGCTPLKIWLFHFIVEKIKPSDLRSLSRGPESQQAKKKLEAEKNVLLMFTNRTQMKKYRRIRSLKFSVRDPREPMSDFSSKKEGRNENKNFL